MFRALDKIVNEFAFGPHERKVKKYLNESTIGQSEGIWMYNTCVKFC